MRPGSGSGRFRPAVWLVWLAVSTLVAAQPIPPAPSLQVLQPGPQLRPDGMPALLRMPQAEAAEEPPVLRFADWHPSRAEMLVLARNGSTAQLHRLAGPGQRPQVLTRGPNAVADARFEPVDGNYIVFRRDTQGDEAYRLFRLSSEGGTEEPISPPGLRVSEYQFLRHGGGLVFIAERVDRQDPEGERQAHSRLMWVDPLQPGSQRMLAEQKGGRLGGLTATPDGGFQVLRTAEGRSERLRWPKPQAPAEPLSPPGGQLPAADEALVWTTQALRGEYRHLVGLGSRTGARVLLLADIDADLEAVAAPPAGVALPLALVHNLLGVSTLRLYDPAQPSPALEPLAAELPPGIVRAVRWHPARPWLLIEHVSARSPGRLWVYDAKERTLQAWSPGPRGPAAGTDYQVVRWRSFDGLQLSGLHVAPPAHFEGPRPVMISLHGGPAAQARPTYLGPTERRLVEQLGMHLILPNVRGSDGFGKRFLALDDGRRREDAVKDVSALLDWVAAQPGMDARRVLVEGGSYGGYLSLAVAARESPRILGSISRVGIANFVTFLEQTESYRRDNRRREYGDERDPAMREFLLRISPLTRAADIRKPLFVVHGRNDPRVPWNEARQMVQAVREAGTPVWLLTADDEGHSFASADNRQYLREATLEFVRRLLQGQDLN